MRAAILSIALAAAGAAPAAAHDVIKHVRVPDGPVTVLRPLWPEFRRAGTGAVRLAYHDPDLAARLDVPSFYAYENAYRRAMARLSMRMSVARAEPIARHEAWHAVVGGRGDPVGVIVDGPLR